MSSSEAIVLASGGMDSLTTLAMAQRDHRRVAVIHVSYGQRTEQKERLCFEGQAKFYSIPPERQKVIDASSIFPMEGSALTDPSQQLPQGPSLNSGGIPPSYVPFRNTLFLAMAVSWAEVLGALKVYIGAVWEDSSGYPDCRPSYYKAYNTLIKEGTRHGNIEIITPIIHLPKREILQRAISLGAPLELSWSCYAQQHRACGRCDSCLLRLRAFHSLGARDPISYED